MTRSEASMHLVVIEDKYIHGGDEALDAARRTALRMGHEALLDMEALEKVLGPEATKGLIESGRLCTKDKDLKDLKEMTRDLRILLATMPTLLRMSIGGEV